MLSTSHQNKHGRTHQQYEIQIEGQTVYWSVAFTNKEREKERRRERERERAKHN